MWMISLRSFATGALVLSLFLAIPGKETHHFIYFNLDRQRIHDEAFLSNKTIEGAQLKYTWRELEPEIGSYKFESIRKDLAFLKARDKKLFVQLQDVSFSAEKINVPQYLIAERYHGGVAPQYHVIDGDEEHAVVAGYVARRWDPLVRERFQALLAALGREFDGKIEGINLPETAIDFGETGRLVPADFTNEKYRNSVIENMKALKQAFPKSVAMQYANFMPGEWLPENDKQYLRDVYKAARELHVAVGGPDLIPFRRGQLKHSYPLIRDSANQTTTGIAVQEGNYGEPDPATGRRKSVAELFTFATSNLQVDYIFWFAEEPYYSKEVLPFLTSLRKTK